LGGKIGGSSSSSFSCCSCFYIILAIIALILYLVYKDQISPDCDVNFNSWFTWSFVLNFTPPVLIVIASCILLCTGLVNCISVIKHADDATEGEEAKLVGTKTKALNVIVVGVIILVLVTILILTMLAYAWLIVGTVWIAENSSCLTTPEGDSIYYAAIYWIVVQYVFLTLSVLGILISICCLGCCTALVSCVLLAVKVVSWRLATNTLLGDGSLDVSKAVGDKHEKEESERKQEELQKSIRAHGNFGEYVPFSLLLLAFFGNERI